MKNWRKYFPSTVRYGYDDKGYFFFDSRTRNILLEIRAKRCPEDLLEGIQSVLNGKADDLEDAIDVENSYKRNGKVYITYKGRRYTIEFGVSYYLQFECPNRFDKDEAEECEKEFVDDFVSDLQILINYELV